MALAYYVLYLVWQAGTLIRTLGRETTVTAIELDGSEWDSILDFIEALKAAIGAPDWHGSSPDAFVDSIIWGSINSVKPPFVIIVKGWQRAPSEVVDYLDLIAKRIADGVDDHFLRKGEPVDVSLVRLCS